MDDAVRTRPSNYDRMRLQELEELTVHRDLRVAAALHYCDEGDIPPPAWVVREAVGLLCELLRREKSEKRGRSAGRVARYRQDQWDLERLDAIEEVRRIRQKVRNEMKLMRSNASRCKGIPRWRNAERLIEWFKFGTLECASMYLRGREAWAPAETIKASYRRCNRRAMGSTKPDRYFLFDEAFLVKLGFPRLSDRKAGTKWLPLYDLKP
jgi:hypothetical protein